MESESHLWDETLSNLGKLSSMASGLSGLIVKIGFMEASCTQFKIQIQIFEFFILNFSLLYLHYFWYIVAFCLAGFWFWLLHSFISTGILFLHSQKFQCWKSLPCESLFQWWFLCLIVSASSQLRLSHGSSTTLRPFSLCMQSTQCFGYRKFSVISALLNIVIVVKNVTPLFNYYK